MGAGSFSRPRDFFGEGMRDVCHNCDLGSGRASGGTGAVISGSAFTTAGWEFFSAEFHRGQAATFGREASPRLGRRVLFVFFSYK
jgi:hypothetical protein